MRKSVDLESYAMAFLGQRVLTLRRPSAAWKRPSSNSTNMRWPRRANSVAPPPKMRLAGAIKEDYEGDDSGEMTEVDFTPHELNPITLPIFMLVLPEGSSRDLDRLERIVGAAIEGGAVNMVQLREAQDHYEEMESASRLLSAKFPSIRIIVNSSIKIAEDNAEVGLQMPELVHKFIMLARERTGKDKIIGGSCHSVASAEFAMVSGADFLVVGTMYETASHSDKVPEGLLMLRMVRRAVGDEVPLVAIGGVGVDKVVQVVENGADGIAVMTGITDSSDPRAAAAEYRKALDEVWVKV